MKREVTVTTVGYRGIEVRLHWCRKMVIVQYICLLGLRIRYLLVSFARAICSLIGGWVLQACQTFHPVCKWAPA